nr:hypothetical protein Q903MT_gene2230 [Picea sitchensis]
MPDLLSIIPLCHYLMPYRIIWLCFLPNTLSLIAKPVQKQKLVLLSKR